MNNQNFEDVPLVSQPSELKINLFPHQLASVYKMEQLERDKAINLGMFQGEQTVIETKLGINGSETGVGKTLEMVTLILRDRMPWDMNDLHVTESVMSHSGGFILRKLRKGHERNNITLILVNKSIVHQWLDEFSHTPLRVKAFTTEKEVDNENLNIDAYNVVITTPNVFNRLIERFLNVCWKRFIFDEPGHIRVPKMRNVISGFMWFVTATPYSMLIQHKNCKTSFMHMITHQHLESMFKHVIIANPPDFIRQSFAMPKSIHTYYKCYSPLFRTFNGMVNERIIGMIEANNIDGAIQALGGGSKTCDITTLVKNKKLEELEDVRTKIRIYTMRDDQERVTEWKEREIRVLNQLKELDKRFEDCLSKECNICYSGLQTPVMEPACQNIFCAKCLLTWLKERNTCPYCRALVNIKNLVYIVEEDEKKEEKEELPTKEKVIIDLLRSDGKFILFSSYDESFKGIQNLLWENHIKFCEVKGTIKAMEGNIQKFKNGEIKVMFLNSKFHGAGLNLQEATDVIIYHKMEDNLLRQVLGRANRIGRKESLKVHHLVYE